MDRGKEINILNLPPEILVHIFRHLPYHTLKNTRRTCITFNSTGLIVQSLALHRLKIKVDEMVSHFVKADWLRINHSTMSSRYLSHKRMNRGASSIMILAGLIRTADAGTFYLIQEGILPPFPGLLLDELEWALTLATRRNPLVGKKRLQKLYNLFVRYLKENDISPDVELNPKLVYRSIVNLLECLSVIKETFCQTAFGLEFNCNVPPLPITMDAVGDFKCSGITIINLFMQLGAHTVRKFIYTDQPAFIADMHLQNGTFIFTSVQIVLSCSSQEKADVTSLKQMQRIDPLDFCVSLSGSSCREALPGDLEGIPWVVVQENGEIAVRLEELAAEPGGVEGIVAELTNFIYTSSDHVNPQVLSNL